MIYMLVDMVKAQAVDLSKLRTILYGGSPIAPERLAECLEVIGPVFVQSYGMTEAVGGDTHLSKADHLLGGARLSSAGQPSLHVELQIVDEDGITVDRSEEHTSDLQSLMRISYDVFCLKKKKQK